MVDPRSFYGINSSFDELPKKDLSSIRTSSGGQLSEVIERGSRLILFFFASIVIFPTGELLTRFIPKIS